LAVVLLSIRLTIWQDGSLFKETFMVWFHSKQRPWWLPPVVVAGVLSGAFCGSTKAQAVAEAAGATSVSATATGAAKPAMIPKLPGAAGSGSQHLIASGGPPPQETNVREFQAHAGKDAGKVLLRATPSEAQIWVNGKIVGKTPLLLVLAPGKYEVEMRGARGESGKSMVDLLPRETRELQVKLHSLYPARVKAQQ
jgi:PEGA domain